MLDRRRDLWNLDISKDESACVNCIELVAVHLSYSNVVESIKVTSIHEIWKTHSDPDTAIRALSCLIPILAIQPFRLLHPDGHDLLFLQRI